MADRFVSFLKWWLGATGVGLLLYCSYAGVVSARFSRQFSIVGRQGMHVFVVVRPEIADDRAAYLLIVRAVCSGKSHCQVNFWTSRSSAATKLPMEPYQYESLAAVYNINRFTHLDEFTCHPFGEPGERCAQ